MYTFRKPYRELEFTPEYFQERGELALFRALNIGRVIGFVGSGATMAYGRVSWKDLVLAAIKVFTVEGETEEEKEQFRKWQVKLSRPPLSDQLQLLEGLQDRIESSKSDKDTFILALGLTEELANLLDISDVVRRRVAKLLIERRADSIKKRNDVFTHWGHQCRFEYDIEPIRSLIEHLGVSRFLTLNYDVEIERDFTRLFRFSNRDTETGTSTEEEKSSFRALIKAGGDSEGNKNALKPLNHYLDFSDGLGSSVLSVNLSSKNVGELTNFALLPNRYSAQVFHLHGRYDDPESMVLTEHDYLSRYLSTGEDSNAFDEALSTVFKGNDVLLVGVGMDEADMFRPLRQFTTKDSRHDLSTRNVYTLRERTCQCDVVFSKNSDQPIQSWLDDFDKKYLKFGVRTVDFSKAEQKSSAYQCYLSDAEFSLKMKSQYGIYTLFYGDEDSRLLLCLVEVLDRITKLNGGSEIVEDIGSESVETAAGLLRHFAAKLKMRDLELFKTVRDEQRWLADQLSSEATNLEATNGHLTLPKNDLKSWARELKSLFRARLLDLEFKKLSKRQSDWWSDWRRLPEPRSARFRKTYLDKDIDEHAGTARHPCLVRHKPEYSDWTAADGYENLLEIPLIASIRNAAKVADEATKTKMASNSIRVGYLAKRVVRLSMDRGSGKGSLLHILQQEYCDPETKTHRRVLDTIFDNAAVTKSGFRYHGSFLVHLSFSMEFASVIESCSRFVQDALIGLFVDEPTAAKAIKSLKRCTDEQRIVKVFKDALSEKHLMDLATPSKRSAAEAEINKKISLLELGDPPVESMTRNHRIQMCREMIQAFTDISGGMAKPERLFFCFSGLDQLCDDNSVAHNPMFRAFFRLLTGNGQKYKGEADENAPFDLVFISGDSRKPVRYLSEQLSSDAVGEKLSSDEGNWPHYVEYKVLNNREIYLKLWDKVEGLRIKDRFWLKNHPSATIQSYYKILVDSESDPDKLRRHEGLRERLQSGVALSSWCAGAMSAALPDYDPNDGPDSIHEVLKQFDAAADQSGLHGLLLKIFEVHYRKLRADWQDERDEIELHEAWPDALNDLFEAIMKHLSLFPIPVELRVLYGCDEINFLLHQICKKENGPGGKPGSTRKERLQRLSNFLNMLAEHFLLIRVQPKVANSKDDDHWNSVFTRYTLQNQLRDFVARQMDLRVPDRGKQNFFLTSIYCDQPEDLPTPTEKHYKLFRNLVDRQITQARNSLWCLHQLKRDNEENPDADVLRIDSDLAYRGLKRRLEGEFSDRSESEIIVDPTMASFCAVSHRIRALYSLLRGSFSVGAITRLEAYDDAGFPDQPLERFRGWLRGVTNAATSLGYAKDELDNLGGYSETPPSLLSNKPEGSGTPFNFSKNLQAAKSPLSQPLYRDEFGWLFNERGLIALVQGNLFDAVPLFERAIRVMSHRDNGANPDPALHAAVRRVRLNLAIAQIERGNLDKAERILEELVLPGDADGHLGSTVSWMCGGYLGMIRHLGGDLPGALSAYDRIINRADEKRILRLQSIFRKMRADLHRRMGDFQKAEFDIENAIASAQYSEQRDIYWSAKLARIKLKIKERKLDDPVLSEDLIKCIDYARTMCIPRLESDALRIQAELLLEQGDKILAGNLAASSAGIASRAGLRLMKISAMLLYGRILVGRQNSPIGERIAAEATREAERRGYLNQVG